MKVIRYLNIFVFPFVLMIATSSLLQELVREMKSGLMRSTIYTALGLCVSFVIFVLISSSFQKLSMKPMRFGGLYSLLWGLLIGLTISFCSGIGFGLLNGYSFQPEGLLNELHLKVLGNSYPALCEELIFRGGIVEGTAQLFGNSVGMGAGSLPFGVLHLVGIVFGNSVTIPQILGISLAGLMLSLVYLRFGILGSVACHLVWNSLVSGWIKVYGITDKTAVSSLEGSWVTCAVLMISSVLLFLSLRRDSLVSDPDSVGSEALKLTDV